MNDSKSSAETVRHAKSPVGRNWWVLSLASIVLPWLCQPPLRWWPFACVAIIPLLIASKSANLSRRHLGVLYFAATVYWALTLQGLRFANPLIYPCWIALAAYLAVYPIAFVVVLRRMSEGGFLNRRLPTILAAPVVWVGMECVRNYMLTGISAAMLGHSLADVPTMIQIADLGGTYAVSTIIVVANVGLFQELYRILHSKPKPDEQVDKSDTPNRLATWGIIIALWAVTFAYGRYRIGQPTTSGKTTIALIGRSESVEYEQDETRELELFGAYANESVSVISSTDERIDAVVWPESMFTGTMPWSFGEGGSESAQANGLSAEEERLVLKEYQRRYQFRAANLQTMLAQNNGPDSFRPDILGGCGVVDYGPTTHIYSGIVQIGSDGNVRDWYGKTHLVMFGEYIPLVQHLPVIRNWLPKNMGLTVGDGAKRFSVGESTICPNICIETAVERVPVNHLRQLRSDSLGTLPDFILTVTNDGWFDDSSVVQHHKRCAQLVAVACRRPILSAANIGPTVWIDSCGRVIDEIPQGGEGGVIATPRIDHRTSLAVVIGDWPARLCAFVFLALLIKRRKSQHPSGDES
ncbi:MAG: apolipoprotein N-acyltransferase [Planctomycetales bacterium]|nr:apolipoprotein N-acyltransferase [Planctomycetales bacterium]